MKSFYLFFLSALFAPVLSHQWKYSNCNNGQIASVKNTLSDIQLLARAAADASEGGHGKTHAWFGRPYEGLSPPDESLNSRYHKIANSMQSPPVKDITIDCNKRASCCSAGRRVLGCGDRPGEDTIYLCSGYWDLPQQRVYELAGPSSLTNAQIQENYQTQAWALLHEISHAAYATKDQKYTVKDRNGNPQACGGYGQYCVLKLAEMDPDKARRNADTVALFALAAYYGISKFQTDPNLLEGI
ncbi:hypothetical protein DE146DRAFT_754971 [Phaeosphaeria sp. MPI-PUGE-AT-0046c]|nr:hypothetical protein DE146DRAFT_754971 [Phaeosphaeria sp. MPI-PUGE-AT-0046c]